MKPSNITCPECGLEMISRKNSSTGQRFWGCRDYPACRGTRNTDGEVKRDYNEDDKEDEPKWKRRYE